MDINECLETLSLGKSNCGAEKRLHHTSKVISVLIRPGQKRMSFIRSTTDRKSITARTGNDSSMPPAN